MHTVSPPHTPVVSDQFVIELTFPVQEFHNDWKQCSLLANYIAEYTAYQFEQQERAENIISTVTNELLEAIIYLAPSQSDLMLQLTQREDGLQLNTSHLVHQALLAPYIAFLDGLEPGSTDEPYLTLLTTAEKSEHDFNQLGLMMVSHDFGVHIARMPAMQPDRICIQLFIDNEEFQI